MRASPTAGLPWFLLLVASLPWASAQQPEATKPFVAADHYTKEEHAIPMRDGVKLHTVVYRPKDTSRTYPFLMNRTPYSAGPYGTAFRGRLGPPALEKEGFIFVYQDVRGCHKSEGKFRHVTPHCPEKKSPQDVDESTDTHDTIEWLLKNVPGHNGRVGQWGISYPGFYAAAGMIDAHPALKAVSPQAPVSDFYFDDFHHHGAFFLPHAFNFFINFQWPPDQPRFRYPYANPRDADGYAFFLRQGALKNLQDSVFKGKSWFWTDLTQHPNYDAYWQSRNILPHLKRVAPAVLTVGGWFDAEDLYGPLQVYRSIEEKNPSVANRLVMGPWAHGQWARGRGEKLGNAWFGSDTAEFYRDNIEAPFFRYYLKDQGEMKLAEATIFATGANEWRQFDSWPPKNLQARRYYFQPKEGLGEERPPQASFEEFISDPAKPVPFTEAITPRMTVEYMTDDQRFASRRPDVLVFQTEPLAEELTLAGPLAAELFVSTSQQDADWVVKIIDVFPDTTPEPAAIRRLTEQEQEEEAKLYRFRRPQAGYQMMVRSEVIRGRFRNSVEKPEPFTPGEVTRVKLPIQDVLHTFKKGHRLMVQVQSSWFPLVDRNPQKWVDNIFEAKDEDFTKATHRVYLGGQRASSLEVGVLK